MNLLFDMVQHIFIVLLYEVFTHTQATLWDHSFGSSTMIIHVEGTHTPGASTLPECVKADIYLPQVMMNEHPETHPAIAQIVQSFIEVVGIPTIHHWTCAAKNHGWLLCQAGHVHTQLAPSTCPLVPSPLPGTSHYYFYGHPYGSLSNSI